MAEMDAHFVAGGRAAFIPRAILDNNRGVIARAVNESRKYDLGECSGATDVASMSAAICDVEQVLTAHAAICCKSRAATLLVHVVDVADRRLRAEVDAIVRGRARVAYLGVIPEYAADDEELFTELSDIDYAACRAAARDHERALFHRHTNLVIVIAGTVRAKRCACIVLGVMGKGYVRRVALGVLRSALHNDARVCADGSGREALSHTHCRLSSARN